MLEAIKNIILDHGVTLFVFGVAITLIMIGIRAKWVWVKQVFFNLAGICVAIGFYGIYLSWTAQTDHTPIPTYDGNPLYFADKTIVGYGPGSTFDGSIHSTKLHTDDSSVIYDVQYNFKSGWRHCAASDSTSTYHAILLGGSFAFGEGLGDEHTIPYQFQSATDTSFALRNYGFHGHGSHQALSIVEHILTQDTALLRAADVHIYYFSIADHIRRAAGKTFWDVRGPWYEMEGEQLAYKGTFKELHAGQIPPGYLTTKLQMMGQRSALYQKFFGISLTNTEVDFIRFEAIIRRMHQLLQQQGMTLHLITAYPPLTEDETSSFLRQMQDDMRRDGIDIIDVTEVIVHDPDDPDKYKLKGDGHPNGLYNEALAKAMAKRIVLKHNPTHD